MSALEDLAQALGQVQQRCGDAQGHIESAGQTWGERAALLSGCLSGSADAEAQELLAGHEAVAESLREQWRQVAGIIQRVESYRASLMGDASPSAPGGGTAPAGESLPASVVHVTARDGSQYPAAARWAIDEGLPARVRRGTNTPTVGFVQVNEVPMRMQSGDDGFSDMVDERLRELGVRRQLDLRRHVEMKAAAMLLRSSQRHQEVVINHSPCGSERGGTRGCHEMLPAFLREGYSLTVHGTDEDGAPFSHTYRGSAP